MSIPDDCTRFRDIASQPSKQETDSPIMLASHWRTCVDCRMYYARIAPAIAAKPGAFLIPGSILPRVEKLIDEENLAEARAKLLDLRTKLSAATEDSGEDDAAQAKIRIKQLLALADSREAAMSQDPDERAQALAAARNAVDHLWDAGHRDTETAGIRGGVLKRLWLEDRTRMEILHEALQSYEKGWNNSQQRDPYTGVNVASLQLMVGEQELSRKTARILLNQLADLHSTPTAKVDYWDRATMAELHLLVGEEDVGRAEYDQLFSEHPDRIGANRVAATQANLLLSFMGSRERVRPPM